MTCSRHGSSCCLGVREGLAWRGKGSRGGPSATCVVFLVSNAYKKKKNDVF